MTILGLFTKVHPAPGSRPGTLVIPEGGLPPTIHAIEYDENDLVEKEITDLDDLGRRREGGVLWVDVQGLGDEGLLRELARRFNLHALALEDVVNVPQRPKAEQFDDHLFMVTRMVRMGGDQLEYEQVGIFVGTDFVLTFQERHGDILDPIRERLRRGQGPIRHSGADYLAYAILDRIIDGYYPVLEVFGESIEALEEEIFRKPVPSQLERVFAAKRDLLALRRAVWPQREALNVMIRDPSPHLGDEVRVYLRDCYDHCVQSIDIIETFRELAGNLMDLYLSTVGNTQNEVMKTLTIMASIFIPLTFVAGIYGMNFDNMPELRQPWMYPVVLGIMIAIAVGMLAYFRRKGWLGGRGRS